MEDREAFTLHSLDRYSIEQQLLDDALDGVGPDSALASVRALGVLPPGGTGGLIFDELCANVTTFADAIRQQVAVRAQQATIVHADIGDFALGGRIDRVRGDTLLHYRLTRLKTKDFVRIWIEHLARNLTEKKPALLFWKRRRRDRRLRISADGKCARDSDRLAEDLLGRPPPTAAVISAKFLDVCGKNLCREEAG